MNGMDDNEDETDLFDDDDFDNLSESALQALEQNAILSTQRARASPKPSPQPMQRPAAIPQSRFPPEAPPFDARPHLLNSSIQRHLIAEVPLEDDSFELGGEEGVPTPIEEDDSYPLRRLQPGEAVQREHFRRQRYGQGYDGVGQTSFNQQVRQHQAGLLHATPADGRCDGVPAGPDEMVLDGAPQKNTAPTVGDDSGASRRLLEQLMGERDELARELQATKDTVSMQRGEISIIRTNFDKDSKVFDRQIAALKKTMEEESAKHAAALNALNEKNNHLSTRYRFLQQEHNQELQETKTLRQRLKDRPHADRDTSPATTPKRGMASSLRDGFDDNDIMVTSPSKSARRSKPTTPTAANKRKRKADGPSPVKPLVLRPSSTNPPEMPPPPQPIEPEEKILPVVRKDKQAERNLRLLQSILEYRVKETKQPLFEALGTFSLPSKPSKTFSTILLEGTAQLNGSRLGGDLVKLFTDLWAQSLKEQYYQPITLLVEIVNHIVDLEVSVLDSTAITSLILVLQTSVAINAEKRFTHSPVNHATFGKFRQTPQSVLNKDVNGTSCLELMLTVAYTVSDDPELLSHLWRLMDPEFVLMMLNAWQPISDITLMLRLLDTSIFPGTFGSICVSEQQGQVEHWIMNRICYLLWETPKVDEGLPPNTSSQLAQLRLEVMDLLIHLGITSSPHPHDDPSHHGSKLIASDLSAIARIVRSLHDEVAAMYDLTPSHSLHAQLVNKGIALLYHILSLHSSSINLQEKLSVINGGVHKHRVVLTRLAFSEGRYIDREITDETVAMATSMLEDSVTPDEADELIEAFPGFKGRVAVESDSIS